MVFIQLTLDDAFEMQELLDDAICHELDPEVRAHIEAAWLKLRLAMRQAAPALSAQVKPTGAPLPRA